MSDGQHGRARKINHPECDGRWIVSYILLGAILNISFEGEIAEHCKDSTNSRARLNWCKRASSAVTVLGQEAEKGNDKICAHIEYRDVFLERTLL